MQATETSARFGSPLLTAGLAADTVAGWVFIITLAAVLFPLMRNALPASILKLYELIIQKNTLQL